MADDRCFEHGSVSGERRFDFERRDVDAADLEHVVGAAAIGVIAVAIDGVFVPALGPRPEKGGEASRPIVPVVGRAGGAADLQLADLAGSSIVAGLVDDTKRVSGHRLARGAVANFALAVGKKNMQEL